MFDFEKLSLEDRIRYFIKKRIENEFWDFKMKHAGKKDNSDLIKDIVCFTNTTHDRDCYLIYGISDDFKVIGIEDSSRLQQANIEDILSKMQFAGGIRPEIRLNSIFLEDKEVQVITIKNERRTPIYLEQKWGNMLPGCIYSRHGDRNTPDNKNSTQAEIEALWKKRFNLLKTSLDFVFENLNREDEWIELEGNYYNTHNPAYNIRVADDNENRGALFYHFAMINEKYSYEELSINFNEIKLASYLLTWLDSGRLRIPVPEWGRIQSLHKEPDHRCYCFFNEESNRFKLLEFLYDPTNEEQNFAMDYLKQVILFFRSSNERKCFDHWISPLSYQIKEQLEKNKEHYRIKSDNPREIDINIHQLALGETLNCFLEQFRKLEEYEEYLEFADELED